MSIQVLIVDDEPNVRLLYRSTLDSPSFAIHEADSAESALKELKLRTHDVAILDLRMPGMNGMELLSEMRKQGINTPVVIITAYGDVPDRVKAFNLGAIDFLQKPLLPDQLRDVINDIVERHAPEAKGQTPSNFDDFVRSAKRAINLRDFVSARAYVLKALTLNPKSLRARNLCSVMLEMEAEHAGAAALAKPEGIAGGAA